MDDALQISWFRFWIKRKVELCVICIEMEKHTTFYYCVLKQMCIYGKHRLRSSITSASACEGGLANLVLARWTSKQWVPGTKKMFMLFHPIP